MSNFFVTPLLKTVDPAAAGLLGFQKGQASNLDILEQTLDFMDRHF